MSPIVPRQSVMQAMKAGDSFIFAGEQSHRQQVTTIVSRVGGKFRQEAACLVDSQGRWVVPVTVVTCEVPANKPTKNATINALAEALAACRMVVARWESGDLAEAARACQAVIDEHDTDSE